ncbi:MAG: hypothetical protein HYZ48_00970, partial [Chlamydiales bacterium]|nr:hypothetical protein [Chlamydiales bacterium]
MQEWCNGKKPCQHIQSQTQEAQVVASIYKRKSKDGKSTVWRAIVRIKGYPTTCNTFDRKQEADDWVKETERCIKLGQYNFFAHNKHHTYSQLIDRLHADGALTHHRCLKNCQSQFNYWKQRLGSYALIHITPELIAQERKLLIDTPLPEGNYRSASTINRYTATLSSTLGYA